LEVERVERRWPAGQLLARAVRLELRRSCSGRVQLGWLLPIQAVAWPILASAVVQRTSVGNTAMPLRLCCGTWLLLHGQLQLLLPLLLLLARLAVLGHQRSRVSLRLQHDVLLCRLGGLQLLRLHVSLLRLLRRREGRLGQVSRVRLL
jgi:hypothetical protein